MDRVIFITKRLFFWIWIIPQLAVAHTYILDGVTTSKAEEMCLQAMSSLNDEVYHSASCVRITDTGGYFPHANGFVSYQTAYVLRAKRYDGGPFTRHINSYFYWASHPGSLPIEKSYFTEALAKEACIEHWTQVDYGGDVVSLPATCKLVKDDDRRYYSVKQEYTESTYSPPIDLRFYFTPPQLYLNITQPQNGTSIEVGKPLMFKGSAILAEGFESEDKSSLIEWYLNSRNSANYISTGASGQISSLPTEEGQHVLIAYVKNEDSEKEQQVSFTISLKPTLKVEYPFEGDSFKFGDPVKFSGIAKKGDQDLSGGISWTSSLSGMLGEGGDIEVSSLPPGEHKITAKVTNNGLSSESKFTIYIDKSKDDENLGDDQACSGSSFGGNPINLQNGNKIQIESDYIANGRNPLKVVRSYNSLSTRQGVFGYGWAANFEKKMIHLSGAIPEVEIQRDSGLIERFVKEEGRWQGKHINTATLIELPNGDFEYQSRNGWREIYSEQGQLVSETDIDDYSLFYGYVASQLKTITDDAGRVLTFTYHADGLVDTVTTPDQQVYKYEYSSNNLTRIYYPQAYLNGEYKTVSKEYLYENSDYPHALTGMVDETGNRYASWRYDDKGRAIYSEHGDGFEAITIDYVKYGETLTTNEFGKQTTFKYQLVNGVLKTTAISGHQSDLCSAKLQNIEYYDNGFIKEKVDWNGHKTVYEYNERGLTTSTKIYENQNKDLPDSAPEWLTTPDYEEAVLWLSDQPRIDTLQQPSLFTDFEYNQNGLLTAVTETNRIELAGLETQTPQTVVTEYSYEYHPDSNRVKTMSIDGPRDDVNDHSSIEFDSVGNAIKTTNAKGFFETSEYLRANYSATRITDENGVIIQHDVNHRGWLTGLSLSHNGRTFQNSIEFFEHGLKQAYIHADNSVIDYGYDVAHNLIERKNSVGATEQLIPAKDGSLLQQSFKDGNGTVRYQINRIPDEEGRTHKILGAEGEETTFEYDANGNVIKEIKRVSDDRTITTTYRYDWANRVIEMRPQEGAVIQYHYTNDYLTQVDAISGNQVQSTTYQYDGFGNLLQQNSPVTGLENNWYDAAGNLIKKIDAKGITVNYQYDALNRVTSLAYGNAELDQTYVYDEGIYGKNKLTSFTLGDQHTRYQYNFLGQITQQTVIIEQNTFITLYEYGDDSILQSITYPSGRIVRFEYDAAGQISGVYSKASLDDTERMLASDIQYLPFGPIKSITLGNGQGEDYRYDQSYRMTGNANWSEYNYNGLSFITSESGVFAKNGSVTYQYDDASRLASIHWQDASLAYGYDDFGNRTSREFTQIGNVLGVEQYSIDATNNQLKNITYADLSTSGEFKYDPLGNMVEDLRQGLTLHYSEDNRLHSLSKTGADVASYNYNNQGQRIRKRVENKDLYFHYDTNGLLIAESNGEGELIKEYIYLNGRPLAVTTPENHVWSEAEKASNQSVVQTTNNEDGMQTVIDAGSERTIELHTQHTGDGETSAYFNSTFASVGKTTSGLFMRDSGSETSASVSVNIIGDATIVPIAGEIFVPIPMILNQKIEIVIVDRDGYETREYYEQQESWLKINRTQGVIEFYVSSNSDDWQLLTTTIDELQEDVITGVTASNSTVEIEGLKKTYTNTPLFVHTDTIGTPKAMTNLVGELVWMADFTPFGDKLDVFGGMAGENRIENSLRFPGQYADAESGYSYNYFRDYDPSLGRYIQSDPIGLNGGINTYVYVNGNPIMYSDPKGLFLTPQTIGGGVGLIVGFGYSYWINQNSLRDALFDGFQAGAAGFISGGGSLITGFTAAAGASAIRSKIDCGEVDVVNAAVNGGIAIAGGLVGLGAGVAVPTKMVQVKRGFFGRVGEKLGLLGPKFIDKNESLRAQVGASTGSLVENVAAGYYAGSSNTNCSCQQ